MCIFEENVPLTTILNNVLYVQNGHICLLTAACSPGVGEKKNISLQSRQGLWRALSFPNTSSLRQILHGWLWEYRLWHVALIKEGELQRTTFSDTNVDFWLSWKVNSINQDSWTLRCYITDFNKFKYTKFGFLIKICNIECIDNSFFIQNPYGCTIHRNSFGPQVGKNRCV